MWTLRTGRTWPTRRACGWRRCACSSPACSPRSCTPSCTGCPGTRGRSASVPSAASRRRRTGGPSRPTSARQLLLPQRLGNALHPGCQVPPEGTDRQVQQLGRALLAAGRLEVRVVQRPVPPTVAGGVGELRGGLLDDLLDGPAP